MQHWVEAETADVVGDAAGGEEVGNVEEGEYLEEEFIGEIYQAGWDWGSQNLRFRVHDVLWLGNGCSVRVYGHDMSEDSSN